MSKDYTQIYEGEWVEPTKRGFINQCCSCGLVHVFDFVVRDSRTREKLPNTTIQFRLKVDRRKTSASRRKFKFEKDSDD